MLGRRCLIIVDVQNDFCPGGSLPVQEGDMVVGPINDILAHATAQGWLIVASQDWHPEHTVHFAQDRTDGKGWPVHCVQNTRGAEFHPDLKTNDQVVVVRKGLDPKNDGGYSAFEGCSSDGKALSQILDEEGIAEVFVAGLATDYCVQATVLDARQHAFKIPFAKAATMGPFGLVTHDTEMRIKVYLVLDAVRAVNVHPRDEVKVVAAMIREGVLLTTAEEVTRMFGFSNILNN